jgi:hypothetical protein
VEDVEKIVQLSKKVMLEVGEHGPTVFYKGTGGQAAIGLAEFGSTADKRAQSMANAGVFAALKHNVGELELIIFVSEAWMGRSDEKGEFIQPSLDPKRIEVLMITYMDTASKEQKMIAYEIVRNPQKKVTDLKKHPMSDTGEIKGELMPAFLKGYQLIRPVHN